jgi:hypothetical protein
MQAYWHTKHRTTKAWQWCICHPFSLTTSPPRLHLQTIAVTMWFIELPTPTTHQHCISQSPYQNKCVTTYCARCPTMKNRHSCSHSTWQERLQQSSSHFWQQ